MTDFSEVIVDLWDAEDVSSPLFTSSAIHHQEENFPNGVIDENTLVNDEPPFVNPIAADFRLDGNASTWLGVSSSPPFDPFDISTDLLGEPRNTFSPTKGCYERMP